MARRANPVKTVGAVALFGAVGLAAAGVVWLAAGSKFIPRPTAEVVGASPSQSVSGVPGTSPTLAALQAALPPSLTGSTPPHLPLDSQGRLAKTHGVREFFDYFLSAEDEMPSKALDALVRHEIAAQLDGTLTQADALDVWQRYTAYRAALAQLAPLSMPAQTGRFNLDATQSALDERDSLASRVLGDWSEPFFGADLRRARYEIARLRITTDTTLTDAQKAARLAALDEILPPEERVIRARVKKQEASIQAIANLQKQGASLDEIRSRVTQELGPEAAERVGQMEQDEDAWRAKYAAYTAERARIDTVGLAPAEYAAQIAQLRQRYFEKPGEAARAASLDEGAGD